MRRIKTVALTFACVVGPQTSVNCVLRLLEHSFRTDPKVPNGYPMLTDGNEDRFATINVPITSIAVSTGQNDSGVFELNFRDERYIPFEGAGAISKWRIELPQDFREFDYNTITDIVIHLRYTALDGGDRLRDVAAKWVKGYIKTVADLGREEGLFALFDLRHDFPNEWYKANTSLDGTDSWAMTLGDVYERLPFFTKPFTNGTPPKIKINATDVYLFSSSALSNPNIMLVEGTNEGVPLEPYLDPVKSFVATGQQIPMSGWQLTISGVTSPLDQLWLVARYKLGLG